ncbi:3-phosphoshikimate 1-carboxyvinyltransferase [Veillonella criceti]|uniref:3-phosphoshikimate 1-carboxyvinyltransferase n=1 Tax=Veillonella criceti TaxID=103891 RepID=A0A380NLI7_9FIRM|nr:3-phosphoshikimate 1-carboxyvinyltransferase [Veillonella criceti]SUP44061.1 3-phosphoshikimate 1-carboxyvinyltransferase [Veillonella criceti]
MPTSTTITAAIPTGTIAAIPAKAHAHRALIAAALAHSPSTLIIAHYSEDIDATIASLQGLGATITKTATGVTIKPIPQQPILASPTIASNVTAISETPSTQLEKARSINAHESGTTLRLLLPVSSAISPITQVTAAGRLPERPLEPLKSQLEAHGVAFSNPKPPFTMTGQLTGGTFEMVGNVSSQFFSGLLLAAPNMAPAEKVASTASQANSDETIAPTSYKNSLANNAVTIHSTTPLQSRDYVELTRKVMADFGVTTTISDDGNTFTVPTQQQYEGREQYPIEGDWSNSAIWLVAAAMTGQPMTITNLQGDSTQADKRIIEIIKAAGTRVEWLSATLTHTKANLTSATTSSHTESIATIPSVLHCTGRAHTPITVDLEQCPDLLPVLAALACSIEGESWFMNGERLRLKESDRLAAVEELVATLGGQARVEGDNLYITGTGQLLGGAVHSHKDHRLVMAATLMALISEEPVIITDSDAINKSYPLFFKHWNQLGGQAQHTL